MKRVTRTFRLPASLVERFDRAAEHAGINKTSVVVKAIEEFVQEIEEKIEKEKTRYALLDITQFHMMAPPAFFQDEHLIEEYISIYSEGTLDEILDEAIGRNARYIHLYNREIDEYGNIVFRYENTRENERFCCNSLRKG